jgi:hypothetical protein
VDFVSQPRYLGDAGSEYVKILDNFLEVLNNASTYMSVEGCSHDFRPKPERQGSRGLPIPHTEQMQPLQGRAEGRESLQGPTTVNRSSQGGSESTHVQQPHPESQEHQPLPSVWDVLERRVRLHVREDEDHSRGEEYHRELREVNRLLNELDDQGTARDRLIQRLYVMKTYAPANPPLISAHRDLSLQEFQQFRSQVEPLDDEAIGETIRQQREENTRKREAFFKGKNILPPSDSMGRL